MMANLNAWLMMGQSAYKKRERRARWNAEVMPIGNLDRQVAVALEVFGEEIAEDAQ